MVVCAPREHIVAMRNHTIVLFFVFGTCLGGCDSTDTDAPDGASVTAGKADAPGCDPSLVCGQAETCVEGALYPTTCGPDNCDEQLPESSGACDADESAVEVCRKAVLESDPVILASLSLSDGSPIWGLTSVTSTRRNTAPNEPRRDLLLELYVEGASSADPQQRIEACRDLTDIELAEALGPTLRQVFIDPRCLDDADCDLLEPLPIDSREVFVELDFMEQRTGCNGNDLAFAVDMFEVDPFWSGPFACGSQFCPADTPVVQGDTTIPRQIAASIAELYVGSARAELYDSGTAGACASSVEVFDAALIEYVGPTDSNICERFREDYDTCVR